MMIVGMVARSPNAEGRVDTSYCGVEGILKGIGSTTTKGSCHITKCLFDIFNDLHGENQIGQGCRWEWRFIVMVPVRPAMKIINWNIHK